MSDTHNAANAASLDTTKPIEDTAAKTADEAAAAEAAAIKDETAKIDGAAKAAELSAQAEVPVEGAKNEVEADKTADAAATENLPDYVKAQRTANVSGAALLLDPKVNTDAPIAVPDQRATLQNLEQSFGPSAAELADAAHSALSPKPAVEEVPLSAQPINEGVPHPTLPHVFASVGRVYNEGVAILQSLESHISTLESEGESEMHAVATRMQTIVADFKNGVENIEAGMSDKLKAAIAAMSHF
jgi:hypothetical protein